MYVLGELIEDNAKYSAIIALILVIISYFGWDYVTTIIYNIIFSIAVYNLVPDKNLVYALLLSSLLFGFVNTLSNGDIGPFEDALPTVAMFVRAAAYIFIWGYWGVSILNRYLFPGGIFDHPLLIYGVWLALTFIIPISSCKVYHMYLLDMDHHHIYSYPAFVTYPIYMCRISALIYVISSVIGHMNVSHDIKGYIIEHWSDLFFSVPFIVFCILSIGTVLNCMIRWISSYRHYAYERKLKLKERMEKDELTNSI